MTNLHRKKIISLVASSFVALASGTPYLYGIYSPQLITRCNFSALASSYLSLASNIGSSIGGFFAGLLIDSYGTQVATALGTLMEFSGFYILYLSYKYAWHKFPLLLLAMINVGFGSVLAYFSTIKVSTINFPHYKGMANALPVSAYGLTALFYALIAGYFFSDNTQGLLHFISIFAGLIIGAGTYFVRLYEDEDENKPGQNSSALPNDTEAVLVQESPMEERADTEVSKPQQALSYLLKGHRGSMAQVNLIRTESSGSLFSTASEVSSLASSMSRSSSYMSVNSDSQSSNNGFASSNSATPNTTGGKSHRSRAFPIDMPHKRQSFTDLSMSAPDNLVAPSRRSSSHPSVFAHLHSRSSSQSHDSSPHHFPASWIGSAAHERIAYGQFSAPKRHSSNKTSSGIDVSYKESQHKLQRAGSDAISFSADADITSKEDKKLDLQQISNGSPEYKISSPESGSSDEDMSRFLEILNKRKAEINKIEHHHYGKHRKKRKHTSVKEHVLGLMKNKLFISHYVMNAMFCAIGQVYIFGVGFIVKAQLNNQKFSSTSVLAKLIYVFGAKKPDEDLASPYQALQVSIISFANFLGRLLAGPMSDLFSKSLNCNRMWVVVIALILSTIGQLSLIFFKDLNVLSLSSLLIGMGYGAVYGTLPAVVAETFGSGNFATTWALMGTGPIMAFLALSDYFGNEYDRHSQLADDGHGELTRVCLKGGLCYRNVFIFNTFLCCLAMVGYLAVIKYCSNKKKEDENSKGV